MPKSLPKRRPGFPPKDARSPPSSNISERASSYTFSDSGYSSLPHYQSQQPYTSGYMDLQSYRPLIKDSYLSSDYPIKHAPSFGSSDSVYTSPVMKSSYHPVQSYRPNYPFSQRKISYSDDNQGSPDLKDVDSVVQLLKHDMDFRSG